MLTHDLVEDRYEFLRIDMECIEGCCCSVAKLHLALCYRVDCSTPGFLVLRYLLEFCSNSFPWSWWCYLTVSSFATPFSSCPQFFPASGSFPMSQFFVSDGQSIAASVLPVNIQGGFPLRLTGLISMQFKGLSRVFSSTTIWKHQFFGTQPSL